MASTLTLTVGLPASGKSTWARERQVRELDLVRVNFDELAITLFGAMHFGNGNMDLLWQVADAAVRAALAAGRSVIVDNTNLRPATLARWQALGRACGVEARVQRFDVSLEECLARNRQRGGSVTDEEIIAMHEQFVANRPPEDDDGG